jgi:hypothetical protein
MATGQAGGRSGTRRGGNAPSPTPPSPRPRKSHQLVAVPEARRIVREGEMIQALHVAPLLKLFLMEAEGWAEELVQ